MQDAREDVFDCLFVCSSHNLGFHSLAGVSNK